MAQLLPTDVARSAAPAWRRFVEARRELEEHEAVVAGVCIRSRRARPPSGEAGPPLVLLAGLGLSGHYLLPLARVLSARLPVWVPDLPGFGRSDRPRTVLDIDELADVVVAWMDVIGLDGAVLVGNSMGCQVAVEAAVRHPHRVRAVVLDAPTIDAAARSFVRHIGRITVDAFREPFSLWFLQMFDWVRAGPRRLIVATRQTFAHRMEHRLPGVTCPALVIRGGRDPIVPERWAEEVAAALPRGSLHVEPGGSHAMPYSAPDRLGTAILRFVDTL
jgi:pimeloyl-ACP methyl ester carboxylesterase